jgi:hypothetical protein
VVGCVCRGIRGDHDKYTDQKRSMSVGKIHARGVWESTPAEPTSCGEVHDEVMSMINTRGHKNAGWESMRTGEKAHEG